MSFSILKSKRNRKARFNILSIDAESAPSETVHTETAAAESPPGCVRNPSVSKQFSPYVSILINDSDAVPKKDWEAYPVNLIEELSALQDISVNEEYEQISFDIGDDETFNFNENFSPSTHISPILKPSASSSSTLINTSQKTTNTLTSSAEITVVHDGRFISLTDPNINSSTPNNSAILTPITQKSSSINTNQFIAVVKENGDIHHSDEDEDLMQADEEEIEKMMKIEEKKCFKPSLISTPKYLRLTKREKKLKLKIKNTHNELKIQLRELNVINKLKMIELKSISK